MSRKKLKEEEKKIKLSVVIDSCVFERLNKLKTNKSKFIGWLLKEYFAVPEEGCAVDGEVGEGVGDE